MNTEHVEQIARALLYEGYLLYPYRRSALKNQRPWNFGIVYPAGVTPCAMTTECLVEGSTEAVVEVQVRFLEVDPEVPSRPLEHAPAGEDGPSEAKGQAPANRPDELSVEGLSENAFSQPVNNVVKRMSPRCALTRPCFARPPSPAGAGEGDAIERRVTFSARLAGEGYVRRFRLGGLRGRVEASVTRLAANLCRLRIVITNETAATPRRDTLCFSLVSTHTILAIEKGQFVSLLDPPEHLAKAAGECVNVGAWPVLVGRAGARDCVLSSPIILYDYPAIAAESPGDLFDGTEIDEILSLRIQALTDQEKEEVRQSGQRARQLLERAESLTAEEFRDLHGVVRPVEPSGDLQKGDRVRLHPKPGADAFDVALRDRVAIIESIQRDMEDRVHVAVVIEDDPGMDLGLLGQPGHRFFFSPDEMERLS